MTADHTPPQRRGRRTRREDTRTALLEAASEVFIERGYERATVRLIATRAGGGPAMVNHWFGGKKGLFATAVLNMPLDPPSSCSASSPVPAPRWARAWPPRSWRRGTARAEAGSPPFFGLGMVRYVAGLLDADSLSRAVGPTRQRYLTGAVQCVDQEGS